MGHRAGTCHVAALPHRLYSLDPQRNAEAAEAISSVFVEEMIHLALVSNLLNAVGDPEGGAIRTAQERFNQTYCKMLNLLEQAFNGAPAMLGAAVGTMYALKGQAQQLMTTLDGDDMTAGPTFDYVAPEDRP